MKNLKIFSTFHVGILIFVGLLNLGMQLSTPAVMDPAVNLMKLDHQIQFSPEVCLDVQQKQVPLWAEGIENAYRHYRVFEISA